MDPQGEHTTLHSRDIRRILGADLALDLYNHRSSIPNLEHPATTGCTVIVADQQGVGGPRPNSTVLCGKSG